MDKEIDLGMDHLKMMEQHSLSGPGGDGKVYPRFHITGPKSLGLPESGEMEIEFKRVSESSRTNEDGSTTYECAIEVRKILECECDGLKPPTTSDRSTEDAIDQLAAALSRKKEAKGNPGKEEY